MADLNEDPHLSALYQRTQKDEPNEFSDALIKKAAKQAISQDRQKVPPTAWAGAAGVVIAVAISSIVSQYSPDTTMPEMIVSEDAVEMQAMPDSAPVATMAADNAPKPSINEAELRKRIFAESSERSTERAAAIQKQFEKQAERKLSRPQPAAAMEYRKRDLGIHEVTSQARVIPKSKPKKKEENICGDSLLNSDSPKRLWSERIQHAKNQKQYRKLRCIQNAYDQHFLYQDGR